MAQFFASDRGSTPKSPKASAPTGRATRGAGASLGDLQRKADNSTVVRQLARWSGRAVMQREAKGGLPGELRSGVEALSGVDMSDVRVHYNSDQPASVGAHAYAQGSDIHIARDQKQHLPHEAWHVAQQKQGRVRPTRQLKGVEINDDATLEKEADVMGAKAAQVAAQRVADTREG